MTRFHDYAVKANNMGREAVEAINGARAAVDKAQLNKRTARDAVSKARAEADYLEAEKKLKEATSAAEHVGYELKKIRAELAEAIEDANSVNPADVDGAALEILKSGICKPGDFARLAEQYKSNRTMSRMIARYAEEAAAGCDDRQTAMKYRAVSYSCAQNTGDDRLDAFDVLTNVFERTVRNNAMYGSWDMLTAEIVETF